MAPEKRMARLRDAGVTPTMQRLAILEYLEGTKSHPTADEVYAALHETCPTIARATVYNTLDLLVESGLISKYTFGENRARYERAFGRQRHDHLICLECGNITEFVNEELGRIEHEVSSEHHFVSQSATFQIFGICKVCRQSRRS